MSGVRASQAYRDVSERADRDEFILSHVDFVRHVVRRTVATLSGNIDIENLEAAGMLGLVEATQRFDEARAVSFRTFAYPRIRGAVLDELRRNCPLSRKMLQRVAQVREATEELPPPVDPESIAAHCGLTITEVGECLEAMRLTRPTEFLTQHEATLRGKVVSGNPQSDLENAETESIVAQCIKELPEQERIVLTLYHLEDLRLAEIGDVLGLSESRISRVLSKAEFRLGEAVKARGG